MAPSTGAVAYGNKRSILRGWQISSSAVRAASSMPCRRVSQADLPNVGIGSSSGIVAATYSLVRGATNIERKRDVHEIVSPDPLGEDRATTAARVLFPAAGRQAQGARHPRRAR